ncbi:MAG: hypothetical protein NXI24_21420 [bacterium]|nr:hypothetical protein [bacterium]
MREFLVSFLNLCHLTLQAPDELPTAIARIPRPALHLGIVLVICGLSTAVAGYVVRDYYDSGYAPYIIGLTIVNAGIGFLWSLILACLVDAFVSLQNPQRAGKVWQTTGVLIMSTLPNIFSVAAAVPARLLAQPELLLVPLQLLLFVWSISIALRGIVYQYEISFRAAVKTYLRSLGLVLLFPLLFFLFIMLEVAGKLI